MVSKKFTKRFDNVAIIVIFVMCICSFLSCMIPAFAFESAENDLLTVASVKHSRSPLLIQQNSTAAFEGKRLEIVPRQFLAGTYCFMTSGQIKVIVTDDSLQGGAGIWSRPCDSELGERCSDYHDFETLVSYFSDTTDMLPILDVARPQALTFKRSVAHDTLVALTVSNHLAVTLLCLDHLKHSFDIADIIIVDDHSVDGTVEFLRKKGYFVISKSKASGLTDSWNVAYRVALQMGYSYLIYANNDVIVPADALKEMRRMLRVAEVVVPLTTPRGAGHNPIQVCMSASRMFRVPRSHAVDYIFATTSVRINSYVRNLLCSSHYTLQSITNSFNLSRAGLEYIDNPRNAMTVQRSLQRLKSEAPSSLKWLEPSLYRGAPRFNGFLFGVNLTGIRPAAFDHPHHLFNASNLVVGQEDELAARMAVHGIVPKIAKAAFVYHFKSVTVQAAWNATIRSFKSVVDNVTFDRRDDIRLYHPELAGLGDNTTDSTALSPARNPITPPILRENLADLSMYPPPSSGSHLIDRCMQTRARNSTDNSPLFKTDKRIVIAFATSGRQYQIPTFYSFCAAV